MRSGILMSMTKSESPFLLVQSSSAEITKTSLSALIQHKMHVTKTYPAMVTELVNGVAFVEILPPLLRQIQEDHPKISSASTMRIHANVRVGDPVLIQVQNGEWTVNTTLTDDAYRKRLHVDLKERLLLESRSLATPQHKRSSKRTLESWLHLASNESTPWGIPGRMNRSQKLVSKKILQWCVNQTGAHFQSRLQEGFPSTKEWGDLEHYFSVFVHPVDKTFVAVSITQDEHKSLVELWADILRNRRSQSTTLDTPKTTDLTRRESHTAFPQPVSATSTTSTTKMQPVHVPSPTLPDSVIEIARSFHLPVPTGDVTPTLSTLSAWCQSDHLLLKERSTDLFLMMLSGGEIVRQSQHVQQSWAVWHRKTDTIDQLCSVVQQGEELAAVRALAGRAFLDPQTASSVCDQLLLRWRRQLIQTHNLADSALGQPLIPTANRTEYRRAMRLHGIQCSDTWLDQVLLAMQIAPKMGMMIVLVGPTEASKVLIELLSGIFHGATHNHIRLPRNRAQLFGKPSSSGDIFLHSDLGIALRKGGHRKRYGEVGLWNPHFVWMDNVQPHAKRDGLSLLIQEMYFGNGVELYSEKDNERYKTEYMHLQSQDNLNTTEQTRRDELEQFFDAEVVGGGPIEDAWRLKATDNTVLFGHIDPNQTNSDALKLIQRALVLEVPDFSTERVRYRLQAIEDWTPLKEGKRDFHPKETWAKFSNTRKELFEILDAIHGHGILVNDLLAKQVSFLLAAAEAWQLPDNSLLTAHICQLLLLPRLQGDGSQILKGIEAIETLPFLTPQLRMHIGRLKKLATIHKDSPIHGLMLTQP